MPITTKIKELILNRNVKHGIIYTFFSLLNSGLGFILVLVLARYLTPSDYGSLNLLNTFITLLNIFISLCSVLYVGIAFFQESRETLNKVIFTVFSTTSVILVFLSILLLLFPHLATKVIGIPVKYIWMGIFISYFQVFNAVNLDIWRLEEKPVCYGIYSVSFAVCNFILTFWFIIGLKYGWEGRAYAWILVALLYFLISLCFLIKRRYRTISIPSKDILRKVFIYALPLIPHSLAYWIKTGMDRYIINFFYNQSIVGYFSFAANLAAILSIIGSAFNSTNSVYIFKRLAGGLTNSKENLSKQTRLMTVVFIFLCITIILGTISLVTYILPKYSLSFPFIMPLCIGALFQCLYSLWVNYLFFYKKTKKLMHITFSTSLVQLFLSYWLTRYSPNYTAYISMFISILTFLAVYISAKKILSEQLEKE